MYEMLNGRPLFNFSSGKIDINEYKKEIILPNNFSEEAKDLITKLLNLDPKKRLGAGTNGFKNLKSHKYFESINWDDLENNGEGHGNTVQYSCLENSMNRRAWRATVHGVENSQTRLSD